jgi:hypothetical protein
MKNLELIRLNPELQLPEHQLKHLLKELGLKAQHPELTQIIL